MCSRKHNGTSAAREKFIFPSFNSQEYLAIFSRLLIKIKYFLLPSRKRDRDYRAAKQFSITNDFSKNQYIECEIALLFFLCYQSFNFPRLKIIADERRS